MHLNFTNLQVFPTELGMVALGKLGPFTFCASWFQFLQALPTVLLKLEQPDPGETHAQQHQVLLP